MSCWVTVPNKAFCKFSGQLTYSYRFPIKLIHSSPSHWQCSFDGVNTRVYKSVHLTDSRGRYAEPLSFGLYRNVCWNLGDKMTTRVTCPVTSAPATAGEAEVTSKCIVIMVLLKSQVSKMSRCKAVCLIIYSLIGRERITTVQTCPGLKNTFISKFSPLRALSRPARSAGFLRQML